MLNTKFLFSTALIVVLGTSAFAKGGDRPTFADLDTNGDGEISLAELQAKHTAKFASLDTDGNGEISFEEMQAKHDQKDRDNDDVARAERIFNAKDKDGSGGLSQSEMKGEDRAEIMLAAADVDGNGTISEEEFNNMKNHNGGGKNCDRGSDKGHK